MSELPWVTKRDGVVLQRHRTKVDAMVWLQHHQPFSNEWALQYEGYAIEKEDER